MSMDPQAVLNLIEVVRLSFHKVLEVHTRSVGAIPKLKGLEAIRCYDIPSYPTTFSER